VSAPVKPCGLCLNPAVLQKSHLLPASGYKIVRGGPDEAIRSPIIVTPKKSFPSDKQITDYFLCRDCEQRFSTHGENYVMTQRVQQNGKFPLQELIRTISPIRNWSEREVYNVSSLLDEKTEQYLYFGASIFWRAAARQWVFSGETTVKIDLGAPYQEDLRRYPLGETEFPSNGRLIVSVSSETEMTDMALTPRKINDRHEFYFFGLLFTLVFDK